MRNIATLWTSIVLLIGVVQAAEDESKFALRGTRQVPLMGCDSTIGKTATFCPRKREGGRNSNYICYCTNPAAMATLAGCYHLVKANSTTNTDYFVEQCHDLNITNVTSSMFEAAYVNYEQHAQFPREIPGFNITIPVRIPVKVNATRAQIAYDSYYGFMTNFDRSYYYGIAILGYWLLVFLLATITNWGKFLFPTLFDKLTGPVSNAWRKYVTLPATSRRKRTNEQRLFKVFDFLVPSRVESLVLAGYFMLSIAFMFANTKYIDGNPMFASKRLALLRYLADRAGVVVSVYMPVLILFAGRNNFLQWLTLWNYATFITFHRWVARVVFFQVFIHAVFYTAFIGNLYSVRVKNPVIFWGVIATISGGLLMFQGMLFLRRRWYEVFLLFHIILAALFIAGAWIHVADMGYVYWYYAATAVWCFDRAVRIAKLVVFGFPSSEVILLADETLKVKVPKPAYWKASPGGFAYIHFLRPSCFWQSHPFTFTDSIEDKNTITLYCKVKGGVTHGLYQYLATHPGKTAHIRVALEGPYGTPCPVDRFNSAVFVAGGNGIPGIYSQVHHLALRSKTNIKQSLKLVWVVREYRSLYWFYEELLKLKDTKVETTVYVTQPESHAFIEEFNMRIPFIQEESESNNEECVSEEDEKSADKKLEEKTQSLDDNSNSTLDIISDTEVQARKRIIATVKAQLSHITFKEGRPSMDEIVQLEAQESTGSTAFVTCGHPIMVDDLRASVVSNLGKVDGKRIDFFEELQVWT